MDNRKYTESYLLRHHFARASRTEESRNNGHFIAVFEKDGKKQLIGSSGDPVLYFSLKDAFRLLKKGWKLILVGSCYAWSWIWRIALSYDDPLWDEVGGPDLDKRRGGNLYPLTYWGHSWEIHVREDNNWRVEKRKEIVCIDIPERGYEEGYIDESIWELIDALELKRMREERSS